MSAHGPHGDATRYSPVHLATRMDDLDDRLGSYEDRTDGLIDDMRTANAGIKSLSEELAKVGAAVIRIETRLGATEHEAEEAKRLAARASDTNEAALDFLEIEVERRKVHLTKERADVELEAERRRDSIRAKQDRRQVILDGLRGAGRWVIAGGPVVILVATVLLRACGFDVVGEALGK